MDAAKKYEYIKTLGEGSYGHVWLCRDRERDCLVAIKKFKDANKDSQAYHLAMREIKLLRATTHEHVVSVIEAFRSQSSGNVYLVMEYADSCLNLELKKHRTGLPAADVMRVTWQLASALQYLHSKKIIHRDLKPANILLTAAGDLKLCDFGFARDLPPAGQQADMSSYVTTRWYRAPEVVVGADYGAAVDIWALGCLFAELLNGQPLFPGASNMDQLALIVACFGHLPNRLLAKALTNPHLAGVQLRTGNPRNWAVALQQRFAPFGEHAVNLLLSCLNPDPLKRATADEVLRSPYFEPIRLKKVPAMNGPPTVSVTAIASSASPPAASAATITATATAAALVHSATLPLSAASAAALVHSATAPNGAAMAAEPSTAAAADTAKRVSKEAAVAASQEQAAQQSDAAGAPAPEAAKRPAQEAELQPERPAPAVRAAEQAAARPAPVHPAIVPAPKAAPAPAPVRGEPAAGAAFVEAAPRATAMEVDTPSAAPAAAASQTQRAQQAEHASAGTPAAAAGAPAAREAQGGEAVSGAGVGLQPPQHRPVLPANSLSMRASVAAIPMTSASAVNLRSSTDLGMGSQGAGQPPAPPPPGKAGATLVHHNKRASEHNIGVYGNHRPGAAGELPMRFARVSVINPNVDVTAAQHDSAANSPATTPTGAAAAAASAAGAAAAPGANVLISPAGSLTSNAIAAAFGQGHMRRRSTATGSRLTRVSHTCEGPDSLLREEDSEDDRSSEQLPVPSTNTITGAPAPPHVLGQGLPSSGAAPLHPSPLRRHSRLAAVTEPGGQYPPGSIAAAGSAAFAAAAAAAVGDGGAEYQSAGAPGRCAVPQMLSPLGRSHTRNVLVPTVSVGAMAAASVTTTSATVSGAAAAATDSGGGLHPHHHHPAAPAHAAHAAAAAAHGQLHATMSSMSLNVSGRERERDVSGGDAQHAGGVLRGASGHNVPTPAAPTVGQMRSFTAQGVATTSAAAAAAAGLMSRPVSNLYICLENGKGDCGGTSSADSSAAVSPCTPNGGPAGGPAPPPGRRHTLVEGPGSILRSMLRSLSTRRSTATSLSGTPADQQPMPTASAAGTGLQHPVGSVGGAPSALGGGGGGHAQASLGSSPFCTSRASSNTFIAGGPLNADGAGSLSGPVALHGDDHGVGAAAAASGLPMQRRATTTALGAPAAGGAAAAAGHARIGLPQLSVRANDLGSGPASSASATGYGSVVVSPAGRRRASALAPGPGMRMSDAGTVASQKLGANGAAASAAAALHGMRPAPPPAEAAGHGARLQPKPSGGKDAS